MKEAEEKPLHVGVLASLQNEFSLMYFSLMEHNISGNIRPHAGEHCVALVSLHKRYCRVRTYTFSVRMSATGTSSYLICAFVTFLPVRILATASRAENTYTKPFMRMVVKDIGSAEQVKSGC